VLKAVRRLRLQCGDRVWVIGQGPIGLLFTRLLALEFIEVIASDLMPERLRIARGWGAHRVLDADARDFDQRVKRLAGRAGFDAVIVTVPSNAILEPAQALLRGGGQILLFAHTKRGDVAALDPAGVCVDEKDILGSYSSDFTLQQEVARLVFSRRLNVRSLISHHFPLENTAAAVDLAARPTSSSLKIMVCPVVPPGSPAPALAP
jgi:L-iditol 2-dehydrogenase